MMQTQGIDESVPIPIASDTVSSKSWADDLSMQADLKCENKIATNNNEIEEAVNAPQGDIPEMRLQGLNYK